MKKLSVLFMLIIMLISTTVITAYGTEVQTRTNVNIQASVPNGFNESITFVLTNKQTGEEAYTWLEPSNNYINTLNVIGGIEYSITINFATKADYSILGISDVCFINGDNFSLRFNIIKNKVEETENVSNTIIETDTIAKENEEEKTYEKTINEGEKLFSKAYEEIVKYNNIDKKNSYLKDQMKSIYDNSLDGLYNHLSNIVISDIEIVKSQLTETDVLMYYFSYDQIRIFEYCLSNKERFMEKINAYQNTINMFAEEDEARNIGLNTFNAIADVWEWIYDYYQQTGIIYDFYQDDSIPYIQELKKKLGMEITIIETTPQEEETTNVEETTIEDEKATTKDSESNKVPTTKERLIDGLKNNIISIAILVIVGIILLVIFLKGKASKKNDIYVD